MNWEEACRVLGITVTATPAEIKTQYLYKAQLLHPDKTGGYPEKVRQKAEEELQSINTAYAVLKDPKNNTLGVPPKLRVSPGRIRFRDVAPGQTKTTVIRIENTGGAYTNFWMDDAPAPWLKVTEVKSVSGDPLPLEATIEATGSASLPKQSECALAIRIENEKSKARDEVSIRIQLESVKQKKTRARLTWPLVKERLASSPGAKAAAFILILSIAGLLIGIFIRSLIPLWLLLSFAVMFPVERWFDNPAQKHKTAGMLFRLVLNLGILALLGLIIWSGVRLFSQQFMRTPLIGSVVFLGECAYLLWLGLAMRKHKWRAPSMKLTIGAIIVTLAVFAFAGVEPFAAYGAELFSRLRSFLQ